MSKLALFLVKSGSEKWSDEAKKLYLKKINAFCKFEIIEIKSNSSSRSEKEKKIEFEQEKILSKIQPNDHLILLDEKGKDFGNSLAFSKFFKKRFELGKPRIIFLVGGAYGVGEGVKQRAQDLVKLSSLTFNHHVASLVVLEQLYRAFCIDKNIPYHNQ